MRLSKSKLDKVGEQTRSLELSRPLKTGSETAPRDETSITPPSNGNQVTRAYRPFSPTEPALPKGVEDPRSAPRKTFNVQPFPKMRNDKEHRREIRSEERRV